ncbi:hypothetical protein SAMN04487964_101432 [Marinobacterium sediminicola]|uniref:FecR protein domain-containing protein n=2 Tax=Marinobacterium sediminicola TaxID=518898 RepID=A0ABY1RWS0_9GAMM|nr:hypothetical protein SAMN04487964_101432 [Marinobacterium sediminicola]
MRNLFLSLLMFATFLITPIAHADKAAVAIGKVDILGGQLQVIRNGETVALKLGDTVYEGDELKTGDNSFAKITLTGDETNNVNLGKNAWLKMSAYRVAESGDMLGGHFEAVSGFFTMSLSRLTEGADFSFGTNVATLNVHGTSWAIDTAGNMICTSGQLVITHAATGKKYTVNPGQMFSLRGFKNNPVVSDAPAAIMAAVKQTTVPYTVINQTTTKVLHDRLGGEADGRAEASIDLRTGNLFMNSEFESAMEFAGTEIFATGKKMDTSGGTSNVIGDDTFSSPGSSTVTSASES